MRRLTLCCLLVAPLALYAAVPAAQGFAVQDPAADEGPTPLQEAMGVLQGNQRKLRKLVADPAANKEALIGALGAMESACLTSIANPPTPRDPAARDEQAAWMVRYKILMTSTLDNVLQMQAATLAGDAEALGAAYSTLNQKKKLGHDTYQ